MKPDCITLEQCLSPGGFVPVPFMKGVEKFEQEGRDCPELVMDPFSAGIVYAIREKVGLFVIDDYFPNNGYWDTNLTSEEGYRRFRRTSHLDKMYDRINRSVDFFREKVLRENQYRNWTRRNKIMASKINRLHEQGYERFAHIGGRGHYDSQRCIALQDLIAAEQKEIIDVVEKTVR